METMETLGLRYFEVVQIQALNLDTLLWMIQFWITATFALIVAFHFAADQLSRPIAGLVYLLYLAVVASSLITYIQSGEAVLYWNGMLDQYSVNEGLMSAEQMGDTRFWRSMSVWGGGTLIALGSVATMFYGLHVRRSSD